MKIYNFLFWPGLFFLVVGFGCLGFLQAKIITQKGVIEGWATIFSGNLNQQEKKMIVWGGKCLLLSIFCFAIGLIIRATIY